MTTPLMGYFGSELRRAREALGVTQRQVADAVHYSESKVGAVERGEQLPSPSFAQLADEFLKTDGLFARMRSKLLTAEVMPQWFRPWVDYEREAVEIRWCEPLLVPGLLQTEEYARALLEEGSPRQAEQLLAARLERQQVLGQAELITIIDESVLRREIGNPEVMYGQLRHLTTVPAVVQVLPAGAATYRQYLGPFLLATLDGAEVGYIESLAHGFVLHDPAVLSNLRRNWEVLRAEALPQRQSRELILGVAETWRHEH